MSLLKNVNFLSQLPKVRDLGGLAQAVGKSRDGGSRLIEQPEFGSNPGALRMFSLVPPGVGRDGALVVVLHGCTQTAASHDLGGGWSTLARRYGFALLMPQQTAANNPNLCFNWFQPDDVTRGHGEVASIRQMVETMVQRHGLDRRRIFVAGLSAGGAMSAAMLATYPEVFAGGAIIAGLPYGIASNVQQALSGMYQSRGQSAAELGGLVRAASDHAGPWPRVSIWHGDADRTVNPGNADAIARQWLDVHGLDPANAATTATNVVDGHPHQVWWGPDGKPVVESYTIARMGHGSPLAAGDGAEQFGVAGAFALEAGISSSYHIAAFFGLTRRSQPAEAPEQAETAAGARRAAAPGRDLLRPVEDLRYTAAPKPEPKPKPKLGPIDIGDVITRALTAAGLMK